MSDLDRNYDAYFGREPLAELIREGRRRYERRANRGYAALCLGSTVLVSQALYRGRNVPREALAPEYRDRIVCWDGVLTDDIVTDVLVLLEADRLAGDIEPAAAWQPRTERKAA